MADGHSPDTLTGSGHIDTVDCLRAFAALSVCLFHLTGDGLPRIALPTLHRAFGWGWLGVDVFFVISGFVIPYSMLRAGYQPRDYLRFLGRRIVRVGPPSWLLVLATVALAYGLDAFRGQTFWSADFEWGRIVNSLAYTIPFTRYEWTNGVLWTLAVEMQFYLVIGLVFSFAFRSPARFLVSAAALCAVHYLPLPRGLVFFSYGSLFAMGGLVLMLRQRRLSTLPALGWLLVLTLAASWQVGFWSAIAGLATALVIAFVRLRSRVGYFFGQISYSLYLVHSLVGSLAALVFLRLHPAVTLADRLATAAVAISAAIVCAWLFHIWVERPFVRLARRSFGGGKSAATAVPAL